ncbi:MAG: hypothetical protein AB1405_10250, partial [Bdellovibrionota bacterium]
VLPPANAARIAALCGRAVPLPRLLDVPPRAILKAALSDKKNRGGKIRYALPSRIGAMARSKNGGWTLEAPAALVNRCFAWASSG